MSVVIQLSSDDEKNEEINAKWKLKHEGSNPSERRRRQGLVKENLTTDKKEKSPKGMLKRKGSDLSESRDCEGATGENWSAFQNFIKICYNTEVKIRKGDSKSLKIILDKLSSRFKNADPEYTQSESFMTVLRSAQNLVESDPSNLFVHMKQIRDELKARCIKSKNNYKKNLKEEDIPPKKRLKTDASEQSEDEELDQDKHVNKRHCKKLELIFEKVYCKVKKLEEKEVDWDAEENSQYICLERYKKRLYTIWEKWQEVRGRAEEVKKLKYRKIAFSGTMYPELDHAIEKFVNKTRCFPDFMDIYKLTSDTLNKQMGIDLAEDQIKSIATAAFQILGNQLQKVRVFDFWNCCMSYLPSTNDSGGDLCDPADGDEALAKALEENKKKSNKNLSDVIDTFVTKQVDEKHEPKDVILGTDDEGSAPSEDEEEEEEEEDENAEDIICISSSSEDSSGETKMDMEQPQNGGNNSSNGNLTELKNKMMCGDDSDSKHSVNDIGSSARIPVIKLVCSGKVKMEPVASCSSVWKGPKVSSPSDLSREKKTKASDNMDIVILSESDSGD